MERADAPQPEEIDLLPSEYAYCDIIDLLGGILNAPDPAKEKKFHVRMPEPVFSFKYRNMNYARKYNLTAQEMERVLKLRFGSDKD